MPCRDYESDVRYIENPVNEKMKKRLDETTRLLCALCTVLTNRTYMSKPAGEDIIKRVSGLDAWWARHQEEDRKAEEYRRKQKLIAEKRKQQKIEELERQLKELKGM